MNVTDWLEKNKLFYRKIKTSDLMQQIREQAAGHMERLDTNRILKRQRPNEEKEVLDYRLDNIRRITSGDVDRWLVKMSRIIRDNVFAVFEGSDTLKEYQDEKSYPVMGEGYGYFEWVIDFVLPGSLKDPNLIKVNLPFIKEDPLRPPRTIPQTQQVTFEELVLPYDQVISRDQVLVFQYGMKKMGRDQRDQPIYFMADKVNWFIYEPFADADKGIVYREELWYRHDSGQLPFVNGIGVYKERLENGIRESYKESIIHSYFEYADEFVGMFSDNQAIAVNHAHPKVVQIELPCPACRQNGRSTGYTMRKTPDGDIDKVKCTQCQGSGLLATKGPFSTLTLPSEVMAGDLNIKPADAFHPFVYGEGLFQTRVEMTWDLLDKGRKSIGLDLLVDTNESGIAKEYRLEDLQDIIGNLVKHIHQFIVNDLWLKECLLQPNTELRIFPKFDIPTTFFLEDETTILENIKKLPLSERQDKIVDYYSKKYKGDIVTSKAYQMSALYAPIQLFNETEIKDFMTRGVFKVRDVYKGMYATWAMKQIGDAILSLTNEQIFARADELIKPFLPPEPIPLDVLT